MEIESHLMEIMQFISAPKEICDEHVTFSACGGIVRLCFGIQMQPEPCSGIRPLVSQVDKSSVVSVCAFCMTVTSFDWSVVVLSLIHI